MTTDQKLMTVKEVAHFLRLSLAETYRLVNYKIPDTLSGGSGRGAIRISEQDVMAFLENRRQGRDMLPREVFSPRRNSKPLKHIQVKK
jgi:predicted DNA-binding transcriptional regulator AlpA